MPVTIFLFQGRDDINVLSDSSGRAWDGGRERGNKEEGPPWQRTPEQSTDLLAKCPGRHKNGFPTA